MATPVRRVAYRKLSMARVAVRYSFDLSVRKTHFRVVIRIAPGGIVRPTWQSQTEVDRSER